MSEHWSASEEFSFWRAQASGHEVLLRVGDRGVEVVVDGELHGVMMPETVERLARGVADRERTPSGTVWMRHVLLWCAGEKLAEMRVPWNYSLPDVGDDVDLGVGRYRVRQRVWVIAKGTVGLEVHVHLEKLSDRSEKPATHHVTCASRLALACDCGSV